MNEIKTNGLSISKVHKEPIKKINVLFAVHNSLPYDNAGYAIRTQMIASGLHKMNIPTLIATRPGYPWDLNKHKKFIDKHYHDDIKGIPYVRLQDKNRTFKKGSDFEYIDAYSKELVKVSKNKKTTIIHAHSNYLNGMATIKASNMLHIPSIYEIRGLWHITRLTLDTNYKNGGMFDYEQEMEKGAAHAADVVITISQALKELITSWGIESKKIHVIPNAVDLTLFKPKSKNIKLLKKYNLQNKIVIGFIGSLTAYEGLEDLILSVDSLIKEGLSISLMIIGDGREKKHLESLSKSKDIIFTGRVPFSEVEEYYSLFDICPLPRNNYEVCRYVPPLKILEAMAMKKAVIVSDVPPLLEIISDGENGLVCQADNQKSLTEKIKQLYNDDTYREKLANNAHQWVKENRSWETISKKYLHVYQSFTHVKKLNE